MTSLPPPIGPGGLVFWRLDQANFAPTWDSGEGSYLVGGRWSSRGVRAVYAALDPATAILEVAVHKTFRTLDTVPHVLTSARIVDAGQAHVVTPADVPNLNWLRPGAGSAGLVCPTATSGAIALTSGGRAERAIAMATR